MLIGKHCSISGGIENACNEALRLGIDTIQVFTKNQRQWREKEYSIEEGENFKAKCKAVGLKIAFSHTIYLINLASTDEIRNQSIMSLAGELLRCEVLGLPFTVLHPGNNKNLTEEEAIARISAALHLVLHHTSELKVKILLENTAGQGASIGRKFEQIKAIMDQVGSDRLGMCFDTCHAFAAGYDIRTPSGMEDTLSLIDEVVGIDHLHAFHLNDSKGEFGSRIDRHEHIGRGKIGLEPFRVIINNFPHLPKVLKTHNEDNMDEVNLEVLRSLIGK
ncbi:deoxyribonuclease IV [soil metagenome]